MKSIWGTAGAVGLCVAVLASATEAPNDGAIGGDLRADATFADVYVNDSLEADDRIAKAGKLSQAGRWAEAADILQDVLEHSANKVVRVAPGRYVGIGVRVRRIIAHWPPEGIAAYRSRFDQPMHEALFDASAPRTISHLLGLFDRYFCTKAAAELADAIGQTAVEAGDFALAAMVYQRVIDDHPDGLGYRTRYGAMLRLIAAMGGPSTPDGLDLDDGLTIRWMGQDRPFREIEPEVRSRFAAIRQPENARDWPVFAGNSRRNRSSPTTVDELGLLWRFTGVERGPNAVESRSGESGSISDRNRERLLSMHPVVADGLVYVQRFRELVALHRSTGALAWRFRAEDPPTDASRFVDEQPAAWDSPTVHDGKVYASLPGEATPYYSYESPNNPSELVCLDAGSGRVIWRLDQEIIEEQFAEIGFDSSPVVHHDGLFVVGRRRRSFGFEDCYLFRFDADTGALVFRTHLGSTSTGTFGSRQATRSIVALQGNTVYVSTNLGTVAAVSRQDGSVRWLAMYERKAGDGTTSGTRQARDSRSWQFNPVIVADTGVFVAPMDSASVFVFAPETGELLSSIPNDKLGHLETLLGVRDGVLCAAGRAVTCYDTAADRPVWSTALPEGTSLFGRGVWGDTKIYIPTRQGLSIFDVADGRRSELAWEMDEAGGNLVVLPEEILVAGPTDVSLYVRRADVWQSLRERMASAPSEPLPALELAEVALSNGEFDEAVGALEEAVRRASARATLVEPAVARRLFDDSLRFLERLSSQSILSDVQMEKLFGYAARFSPDPKSHVRYRLQFAEFFEGRAQADRALRLYQQILRDRTLRELLDTDADAGAETAGSIAESRIDRLIVERGRSIYEPYEAEARRWLDSGIAARDTEALHRLTATFPNSESTPKALVAGGDLILQEGSPEDAAKHYLAAYHRYPGQVDRPELLRKIADSYEQAGKRPFAYRWLTKAAREYPHARIDRGGKAMTFLEYRERLADVRDQVEPSRPALRLPLRGRYRKDFDGPIRLLSAAFEDDPASDWSRFFVDSEEGVQGFDARSGRAIWSAPVAARGRVELLIATRDLALFATPYEIFAVDAASGQRRWTRGKAPPHLEHDDADWEDAPTFRSHDLFGGRLVSAQDDGRFTMIDVDTGTLIWTATHRPEPTGILRFVDRWIAYYVIQDERPMICLLDATTGEWVDSVLTDERRAVEDLLITVDGQVVLATSRSLVAFDAASRRQRWRVGLDGFLRPGSLLLDLDAIYLCDDGRRVRKISLDSGAPIWQSEALIPRGGDEGIAVERENGSIIVSTTTTVSAVDAVSGLTLWEGTTPATPRFVARFVSQAYFVAVDVPGGLIEEPVQAFFYDHRDASGVIPRDGGAPALDRLTELGPMLVVDGALLIQSGSAIHAWTDQ